MGDLEQYLDEFMLKKTVDALITSSVVFYIKCLLIKSDAHVNNKSAYFSNIKTALTRMDGDIEVIKGYFEELAGGMPALSKVIDKEFEVITTIEELIRIAANLSDSDAGDFILVLHKKIQDIDVTKHVIGDIWHLIQPTKEKSAWDIVESMEEKLNTLVPSEGKSSNFDRMNVPDLRLAEALAKVIISGKRKRPTKAGSMDHLVANWTAPS
jgi:hypothetical protein